MSKKLLCLASLALVFSLVGSVSADLVVHWSLEDGSGTIATDVSGNGNDGTLVGSPQWVDGYFGGGLHFDGDAAASSVVYTLPGGATVWETGTIALWVKADSLGQDNWSSCFTNHTPNSAGVQFDVDGGNPGNYRLNPGGQFFGPATTEWTHLALTFEAGTGTFYYNGAEATAAALSDSQRTFNEFALGINRNHTNWLASTIDELRIYDHALAVDEIKAIMESAGGGLPLARRPDPEDGAILEQTWVNLSWGPGDFAVSHNLYFGTNFEDVNKGAEGTFVGNTVSTFQVVGFPGFPAPDGLQPGTTYYWRVDEVNDADPNSPWKGDVWSFWVPPRTAYNPGPVDGMKFVDPNVELSWTGGFDAKLHTVYFGDSRDDVSNAAGALPQADATYSPGPLELDKVYYWRVDEFDGAATHKGDIWSFTTKPFIRITDPTLIGRWTLDEGMGTTALDWSGHGHDASFVGEPWWVDGYDGGGVALDGVDDAVVSSFDEETWSAFTVTLWAKAATVGQDQYSSVFSNHVPNSAGFQLGVDGANPGIYRYNGVNGGTVEIGTVTTSWVHIAVTCDGTSTALYYNGNVAATIGAADAVFNRFGIGINRLEDNFFEGIIDDVRVYDKELTQEEIQLVMRIDPLLAWNASPTDGATVDIDNATPLSWSRGDMASQHEVYLGTDKDAVANADASDTTGIYRGGQSGTSYTPQDIAWGGGPYYWRIDENNTDGTVTKGRIWSFTVADFILVDDFESYTDDDAANEAIWQSWIDGFGVPANGSQVGYLLPPYAEQTIVNSGAQSMPLYYENTAGVMYSEAELTLTAPRDWTKHELGELSLWFRGYPGSVGSFTEGPVGTYTMTGSGVDIWGTADQFHFAHKMLTGAGSIVARVDSVSNTHVWAKAGVMIRETLDAGSKHAFACVTPASGVAFQRRIDTDTAMTGTTETGITAPRWVKVERDAGGNFTVSHSANGTTWLPVAGSVPMNIPMTSAVYIGLALTSHDAALTCQAKFSNVSTTGTVSAQWAHQDVGISSNAAEPLYVALANKTGAPVVVYQDDANAATINTWTEWIIPLQKFADQGVNLADVDRIAIGLGAQGNMTTPGGSGTLFIDDIRLYRSRDVVAP